ncbi:Gfo/Idh/MocA family oxidoreductase [Planctomonas sp. JC2975]|uniref:Gfo/Idh/MocA family protein n=1 Tax=Planctomonas sp. JC2975 TaxID=2729626 RepID=UPI0014741247|nr:Gfo/Idh/MocA family oxidoreductase [Planctomonas sp. JC2975]NNC11563.1 Gfo/Idh/MocA family oxidoreductase [Planctomonas sp. JC2975]
MSAARPTRIAVIGVHGYGAAHVLRAQELHAEGRAELVGLVDPLDGPVVREGRRVEGDLPPIVPTIDVLLAETEVDVVVVATPLHTHGELAARALRAGADVLLEKPPVTDLAAFRRLAEVQYETGRMVQVGFQSLGSLALAELQAAIARGELGTIEAIGAAGSWTRDRAYWTRSPWAGRRELNGVRVSDGAVSNPFAHAVMTSLSIAGWHDPRAVARVETDLHRVNAIDVDDTSALRVHPTEQGASTFDGVLTCAFTLAGPREDDPFVTVRGSRGTAVLHYTRDRLTMPDGVTRDFGRIDLMDNLIDARDEGAELLSPLDRTGGFVSVIESVAAASVHPVPSSAVEWLGESLETRPVLDGVVTAIDRAIAEERLFSELDVASWAR